MFQKVDFPTQIYPLRPYSSALEFIPHLFLAISTISIHLSCINIYSIPVEQTNINSLFIGNSNICSIYAYDTYHSVL